MPISNIDTVSPRPAQLNANETIAYRELLRHMKLKRMCAVSMYLLTDELIYKLVVQTIDDARKALKKLLYWGTSFFATERRTIKLLEKFSRQHKAFDAMIYKMEIAMMPTRADKIITAWLKETYPEQLEEFSAENKKRAVVQILNVREHTENEAAIFWEFTI